ncbi:hypothetical protein M427DRAFT_58926 [Gonapodya prolifera JEL478]|uniref:Uncharacterized protein n=1 Tax=Gonapodya prolifera (strain JEL478) TaxID=1344416 RepID=A0A139A970_GONPJ|nr:hypothetical protein M427DRAFT_58926 [Gonapodya prolifera JEL478]|eukprot:KXS13209.1 hypothetical protein M427DRAFT_58926 [Gonapodya prolifera JEL478]
MPVTTRTNSRVRPQTSAPVKRGRSSSRRTRTKENDDVYVELEAFSSSPRRRPRSTSAASPTSSPRVTQREKRPVGRPRRTARSPTSKKEQRRRPLRSASSDDGASSELNTRVLSKDVVSKESKSDAGADMTTDESAERYVAADVSVVITIILGAFTLCRGTSTDQHRPISNPDTAPIHNRHLGPIPHVVRRSQ